MLVKVYSFNRDTMSVEELSSLFDIKVHDKVILAIDGGSTNTGMSIYTLEGQPLYSLRLYNNNKGEDKLIQFKVQFKNILVDIFNNLGSNLEGVYYEEPYLGYASAVKPLYLLESTIPELKLEYESFRKLNYNTINNKVWKRVLFTKFKSGLSTLSKYVDDKEKIKYCILTNYMEYSGLDKLQQDIYDSLGIGIVVTDCIINNKMDLLIKQKKVSNYKYNAVDLTDVVATRFEGNVDLDKLALYIKSNYKSLGITKKVADYGILKHLDTERRGKRYLDVDLRVRESMLDNSMCIYYTSNLDSNIMLKYNLKKVLDKYGYVCLVFHRATFR